MSSTKGDDDINWDSHWVDHIATSDYHDLSYLDYVKDLLPSPFWVLELGCGSGLWSWMWTTLGGIYTGVDFSKEAIDQAERKNPPSESSLTFHHSDVKDIDKIILPASQDVVWTHTHLQHLSVATKRVLMPKVYDVLKPDGLLVIEELVAAEDNNTSFTRAGWIYFMGEFGFRLVRMTADGDPKNAFIFRKVGRDEKTAQTD